MIAYKIKVGSTFFRVGLHKGNLFAERTDEFGNFYMEKLGSVESIICSSNVYSPSKQYLVKWIEQSCKCMELF